VDPRMELQEVSRNLAGKRAALAVMFRQLDEAPASEREVRGRAIKSMNGDLEALVARQEALQAQLDVFRAERDAIKAAQWGDAPRQVEPDLGKGRFTDDGPFTVKALKSTESLADRFGGTAFPLDGFIRASLTGDWSAVPSSIKAMSTDADLLGGLTVPEPLSNRVIDLSRAASRVIQAGAITIPMSTATLKFARLTQDPTPGWKIENDLIQASDAAFEAVTLTAHTLAARVVMSVELAEDSPSIGSAIENALAQALGGELDRAALFGSGVNPEPLGLINTDGVDVRPVTPGNPELTPKDLSLAVQLIREANGEPNAILWGPDVAGSVERITNEFGNPIELPESVANLTKYQTSRAAETAFIGDWSQLAIGMRQQLRIEASRLATDENGKGFASFSVLVRATLRADVAVLKPAFFRVLTDITGAALGS